MRDRFGVRPLHYAPLPDGGIVFSSEVKGILASGLVEAVPDLEGIDEVFTFWAARPPRCAFQGIRLLPPGHLLVWRDGEIVEETPWWEPRYAVDAPEPAPEELGELLRDSRAAAAARRRPGRLLPLGRPRLEPDDGARRRADRPPAAHVLARLPRPAVRRVARFQRQVAEELGTQHHVIEIGPEEITDAFQDVMRHLETPVIRSAGVPLLPAGALDARAGHHGGRDGRGRRRAVLGLRPLQGGQGARVLRRATPTPPGARRCSTACIRTSPRPAAAAASPGGASSWTPGRPDDPLFSHQTRIAATSGVKSLYSGDTRAALAGVDPLERLRDDLPRSSGA